MKTSHGASAFSAMRSRRSASSTPDRQGGAKLDKIRVYANSHHVTPGPTMKQAMEAIRFELQVRLEELNAEGKLLEAQPGTAHQFRP
jgi:excinuclease UvrABC helicase subunit UvrB